MQFIEQLENYIPINKQESQDKQTILHLWKLCGEALLIRDTTFAHITSSGFILNPDGNKTLMIYHNIYQSWGFTGGHADGETDLIKVACREAVEETGIKAIKPYNTSIASIDILPVFSHLKRNVYVGAHLHLNATFLLIADENQKPVHKPDENSGAAWLNCAEIFTKCKEPHMYGVYEKVLKRAEAWR